MLNPPLIALKGASGGWGWGSLSSVGHSLLSTASTSVSTFTTSVGESDSGVMT